MFREKMHTSNLHNILNKWSLVRKYLTVENFTLCSIVSNNTEVRDNVELITVEIVHGGSEALLALVLLPLGEDVGPVVLGDLRAADTDLVAGGLHLAERC